MAIRRTLYVRKSEDSCKTASSGLCRTFIRCVVNQTDKRDNASHVEMTVYRCMFILVPYSFNYVITYYFCYDEGI